VADVEAWGVRKVNFAAVAVFACLGSTAHAERPEFDVPRHFVCEGYNASHQPLALSVTLTGNAESTGFVVKPLGGSVWPKSRVEMAGVRASYFEDDDARLWYWVKTDWVLNGENFGFGFEVHLESDPPTGAIRFSRTRYSRLSDSGDIQSDPQGAIGNDVTCMPTSEMS
jgi:hypothetical protein